MAQKITDNMKAIPIKNYDFQVDFKVDEKDVMETFLDPTENKHISVLKRPATAKAGTFGTPKVPAKKFETKEASEMNLAIKGSANPAPEGAQVASGNGSIPSNLFKFKSHLPSKKISENPKLALSMFRKKAISNKSGKTIQGNDPFSNTAGPEGFSQTGNLQRPQTAMSSQGIQGTTAMMTGLPNGNKLTVKGAAQLKEMKEKNALKSSGTAHGLFGKLPGDAEAKKQANERPKSAVVNSAVGFMQDLKRTKKLKAPKKPEGMEDEDEEMEPAPEFSDKENSLANTRIRLDDEDKPKVRKVVAPPKKEPVKKKATEEYEEKGDNGENNGNEEEPQEEEEENNPYEKMAKKISKAKKAKEAKVEEEENAEDDVQEFPSDEEEVKEEDGEEHAEVDEDLFGNGEEDYGATESMNPSGAAKGGAKKGAKKNQENEDEEQVNEIPSYEEENQEGENENQEENNDENGDNENNEENNEINNEENNEENNENQEEEEQRQKDLEEEMRQSAVSGTSSTKKFRSSMANEMNELQANLLSGQDDLLSNYGGSNKGPGKTQAIKAKKEAVERKEKTAQDKAKDQFIKDTKKQAGGFVPYKFTNTLDGDTVQQQRDQVTDEITNYLRAADQKRQKKLEEVNKGKKRRDEEAQETNEYSSKLEMLNARLKNSLQGVSKILKSSKAITSSQNKVIGVQEIDSSPEDEDLE